MSNNFTTYQQLITQEKSPQLMADLAMHFRAWSDSPEKSSALEDLASRQEELGIYVKPEHDVRVIEQMHSYPEGQHQSSESCIHYHHEEVFGKLRENPEDRDWFSRDSLENNSDFTYKVVDGKVALYTFADHSKLALRKFYTLCDEKGNIQTEEQRAELFDLHCKWVNASIAYEGGDSSLVHLTQDCPYLSELDRDCNDKSIVDFNVDRLKEARSQTFDRNQGVYDQHLTREQYNNHEMWLHGFFKGDEKLHREYGDVVFHLTKRRSSEDKALGIFLSDNQTRELRPVLVNHYIWENSGVHANEDLSTTGKFFEVAKVSLKEQQSSDDLVEITIASEEPFIWISS